VERNITVARLHAAESGSGVTYSAVSAEALAEEGETYHVVLNMEVVEHVADLPGFLQACCRLVRPGGIMFIATINRNPLSWLFAIVGAEYILRWLPKGTHRWDRLRKPRELEDLLTPEGLELRDRRGVRVNPLTRHFALSRFLGVNYMLAAHRPEIRAG
jgi:2-polyprenyl-6-hydroxyphenyl methylase/3-demethylubiquinone-9 3-methyltransferase